MLEKTGIATREQIEKLLPSPGRRAEGPYAVMECFQKIPCNPCSTSCAFHAILPMDDINDIPSVTPDKCTGCGACAAVCPGLAIFIIDESKGGGTGTVTLPYEFRPLPGIGETVKAVNRAGGVVGDAVVTRVLPGKKTKTPLVTIEVPLSLVHEVRFIRCEAHQEEDPSVADTLREIPAPPQTADIGEQDDEVVICRCEGVTLREIRDLIREGYTTVDEIKRISRAGMGPCQARTCGPLIAAEIARMTGEPLGSVAPSAHRAPVKPLPIEFFLGGDTE